MVHFREKILRILQFRGKTTINWRELDIQH